MRWMVIAVVLGSLTACGGSEVGDAVALCEKEVNSRLTDQMAEFDSGAMQQGATTAADGTITIQAQIKFRVGTSDEGSQPFTCVVATKNEKGDYDPRVIQVQIDPLGYKKSG